MSRSHQKEVAANRAADYRKQVHDLASADYPGIKAASRTTGMPGTAGDITSDADAHYLILSSSCS